VILVSGVLLVKLALRVSKVLRVRLVLLVLPVR
jgi:hypothetical protein